MTGKTSLDTNSVLTYVQFVTKRGPSFVNHVIRFELMLW